MVRNLCLVCRQLTSYYILENKKGEASSLLCFLIRVLMSLWGFHPHGLIIFKRLPSPSSITLGIRVLGLHKHSVYCRELTFSEHLLFPPNNILKEMFLFICLSVYLSILLWMKKWDYDYGKEYNTFVWIKKWSQIFSPQEKVNMIYWHLIITDFVN